MDEHHNDAPEIVVKEKASHRKGRTSQVARAPRVPSQERSRKRYQDILDATISMLQTTNIEDISLHDIGKVVGLPPASVHYLFNTVSAIQMELSRFYNEKLTVMVSEHMRREGSAAITSWQDLVRSNITIARAALNADRAMSEIILAPVVHRSVRAISFETNISYAANTITRFSEFFVTPEIPDMATYMVYAVELVEGLWAASYARHGYIDDLTHAESVRASIAYLRCYLPETMPRKK